LGVGPAGGAGLLKLDGGFAGGFVVGEGAIELGKDFVGGFDWEEGKAFNIANLKIYAWIQGRKYGASNLAIHQAADKSFVFLGKYRRTRNIENTPKSV
jgi:hypothetical protein